MNTHPVTLDGVDLDLLATRFWRLDAMRVDPKCTFTIKWYRHQREGIEGGGAWGRAHIAFRHVNMRLACNVELEAAAEVLLHELVHCSLPPRENHGELFCRRLIACAKEAFGIPVDVDALLGITSEQHPFGNRAYAIDEMLRRQMGACGVADALRADPTLRHSPAPVETPEEREVRMAEAALKRRNNRKAHVDEMVRVWDAEVALRERALKQGRKLRAKWREKQTGYEKREPQAVKKKEE